MRKVLKHRTGEFVMGEKTYVMGILNLTPDSFSDGGSYHNLDEAMKKAEQMVKDGADIIDVGGESTRPGFTDVPAEEEMARVLPFIEKFCREFDTPVSIDTRKSDVALESAKAGASLINDVYGGLYDRPIFEVARDTKCSFIIGHNQACPGNPDDICDRMVDYFDTIVGYCDDIGLSRDYLCLDPGIGIGFGKSFEENIQAIQYLPALRQFNLPVLLGISRKSVIAKLTDLPVTERDIPSIAGAVASISKGVSLVRVHDVKNTVMAMKVADAFLR